MSRNVLTPKGLKGINDGFDVQRLALLLVIVLRISCIK